MSMLSELLRKYGLDIIGAIPYDKALEENSVSKESKIVQDSIKAFYSRLNLPQ